MESNRDEADRCIGIAAQALRESKMEKAEKFLKKAEKLFPSQKAKGKFLCIFMCQINRFFNNIFDIQQIYSKKYWPQPKTVATIVQYQQPTTVHVDENRPHRPHETKKNQLNQIIHPNNCSMYNVSKSE